MNRTHQAANSDVKSTDDAALVVAVLALIVSVVTCGLSLWKSSEANSIAREANSIANTAQASSATQAALTLRSSLVTNTFIARRPDLRSAIDQEWWGPLNLAPSIIQTPYWREQWANYSDESELGYYFLLFLNNGPGSVTTIRFSQFQWEPKSGVSRPEGVVPPPTLDPVRPLHFYALLVDVLQPIAHFPAWRTTNFTTDTLHFRWVYARVDYDDAVSSGNVMEALLGETLLWDLPTPGPLPFWAP